MIEGHKFLCKCLRTPFHMLAKCKNHEMPEISCDFLDASSSYIEESLIWYLRPLVNEIGCYDPFIRDFHLNILEARVQA